MCREPPKITIVTPSFNQGAFLERTILSVAEQDYANIEHIIVDGGSTDGSPAIIERYADTLAYWVSEPDRGQAHAIIKGFERSGGEIMGWLNSDDELKEGAVKAVSDFFVEHEEADFVFGDCELMDREGHTIKILREPGWNIWWQRYVRNCLGQPTCFWRRDLWERSGGLDESLHYAMDYDLWFRMARLTSFWHIPKVLARQRQYAECKTFAQPHSMEREKELVRNRYFRQDSRLARLAKRCLFKAHRVVVKLVSGSYR